MTGYTVHTGTSKKFASGWDQIFGDQPQQKNRKTAKNKAGAKKSSKKKTGKQQASRKKKK